MRLKRRLVFPLFILPFAGLLWPLVSLADITVEAGRGPVRVNIPPSYETGTSLPLLVFLHGFTSSGIEAESYLGFNALSDQLDFFYVHPDGEKNSAGAPFWNATNACCDFFNSGTDDVGYLSALVDSIKSVLSVDPGRIYFAGHSNGGFMSYRMACEQSEWIAGIASLAGATWADHAECAATDPVAVLQIHGTLDEVIRYDGGTLGFKRYPGALETVAYWAESNQCGSTPAVADSLDLSMQYPGFETVVTQYSGCQEGGAAEYWTMRGAGHVPLVATAFSRHVVEWLLSHSKPESLKTLGALATWGEIKRSIVAIPPTDESSFGP